MTGDLLRGTSFGRGDVKLYCKLVLTSETDTIADISNTVTLHAALTQAMLSYVPEQFRSILETSLIQPATRQLNAALQEHRECVQLQEATAKTVEAAKPEAKQLPVPEPDFGN